MALTYNNEPIKWTNEGTAPSDNLKTNGFQAGYKPPAAVFNNQWHVTGECIDELQDKLSKENTARTTHESNKSNPHGVTKAQVGLGNVDNTSDVNKPISTATQAALNDKAPTSHASSGTTYGIGTQTNFGHVKVVDNLNATNINGYALSAAQGKVLNDKIDAIPTVTVEDNLTSTSTTNALSANQGKVLDDKITDLPIKSLEGQSVSTEKGTIVTAGTGATIIGDLRDRTYGSMATPPATGNVASGRYATTIGECSTASGNNATAIGYNAKALGFNSTAMSNGKASGDYSTAMSGGKASGGNSVAMSDGEASGNTSTAMSGGKASGAQSLAIGNGANANDNFSVAIGYAVTASGLYSFVGGQYNKALSNQFKIGHWGKDGTAGTATGTTGDAFIVGNGTADSTRSNCFRVSYDGYVYGGKTFGANAADVAELYEWQDGNPNNEDRRGLFVTLDGTKIKLASPTDTYIKGVISALPCLVGDAYSDEWQGKYLKDVFGVPLTHTVHYDAKYEEKETIDPETGETITETVCIREAYDAEEYILNPDYDPTKEYVPREQRPEFDYVSNWGKLVLVDDGTCEVNGFATVGNGGKATKADKQTAYRVMERRDDTHIYVSVG